MLEFLRYCLEERDLDIIREYLNISGCDTDSMDDYDLVKVYVNYHVWQDERVVQFYKYTNND